MKNLLLLLVLFSKLVIAQVGIGTTTPDESSILEVSSSTKGLLTPRMTETQKNAIDDPATGLLIYQLDVQDGFWYFDGIQWLFLGGESNKIKVGDYYMGGIVFYVEPSGLHGLVISLKDQGSLAWGSRGNLRGALSAGLYGGLNNTLQAKNLSMQKSCLNYMSSDGYGGWYLPSIRELAKVNLNKVIVNTAITNNGGDSISNTLYWSSTESQGDPTKARAYEFQNNQAVNQDKNSTLKYRAIKRF